jgi:glycosyltransferase involved in cell wall biosynthesis
MSTILHPRGDYVNFPRLLVLTSTFPRWRHDVEPPFVFELAKRLVTNFEVHVLAPHASGSSRREVMDGIHVHRFRYAPMGWQRLAYGGGILSTIWKYPLTVLLIPFFLVAQTVSIAQLVKRYRFDVIHAHWIFPQGATALLVRKLCGGRPKVLCTSHGGDLYGLRGRLFEWIKRTVVKGCDHVTVVSQAMRSDILKMNANPRKISVIPMGVELQERFVPTSKTADRNCLLFVGRLVQKKGLRYLLEAMPIIRRTHPEAKLTIAGDGPDRSELNRLADVLGLHDGVEFLGSVSNQNLAEVYQGADVVIFPSVVDCSGDQEGFGLVLVEALGCGCAVVATDLPAMRDIVENGRTGLVVGQRSPEQIAKAVVRLIENPALRRFLAMKGRNHVLKRFDWEAIVHKYAEVIAAMR